MLLVRAWSCTGLCISGLNGTMNTSERFVFLLIEDFSHLAFACAIEPLRIANLVAERPLYEWRLASEGGDTATSSNGATILTDQGLTPLQRGDRLFVVSGINVTRRISAKVLDFLRRERRRGSSIGALCSGAYVLARAGLLHRQACAIHWEFHDAFAEEFPDVELSRNVFVADGSIPTASGGPAASDLMLHLIAEKHGIDLAAAIADQMVYNAVRDGSAPQRLTVSALHGCPSEAVRRAVGVMASNLEDPIKTSELSDLAGVSTRQLERLFSKYLKVSPRRYYLGLRLRRARNLLMHTEMPQGEVAIACGFSSIAHFSRRYREVYGVSPNALRGVALR